MALCYLQLLGTRPFRSDSSFFFIYAISASIGSFPIDSLRSVSHLLSRFPSTYFRSLILNRKLPYHSRYPPSNYIESLVMRRLLIMNHFRGVGSTLLLGWSLLYES